MSDPIRAQIIGAHRSGMIDRNDQPLAVLELLVRVDDLDPIARALLDGLGARIMFDRPPSDG